MNDKQKNIRNFSIIAHIDHGKSTLADRILEYSNAVPKEKWRSRFLIIWTLRGREVSPSRQEP